MTKLGPGLGPAIVAFDLWIGAVESSQYRSQEAVSPNVQVADFIESVARDLVGHARGTERDLLRKGVEETLFVALGQNLQLSPRLAQNRWARYVKAHGRSAVIEMFVANHLWNVLWFRAGDVFGQTDNRAIQYTLRRLRRTCRLLVSAVCQSKGLSEPVSLPVAEEVVRALEASISPS